jgi:hypothetical protein
MRYLWHEWNDEAKPWVGLGTFAPFKTRNSLWWQQRLLLGGFMAQWKSSQMYFPSHLKNKKGKIVLSIEPLVIISRSHKSTLKMVSS